jgi:hypothetical protein
MCYFSFVSFRCPSSSPNIRVSGMLPGVAAPRTFDFCHLPPRIFSPSQIFTLCLAFYEEDIFTISLVILFNFYIGHISLPLRQCKHDPCPRGFHQNQQKNLLEHTVTFPTEPSQLESNTKHSLFPDSPTFAKKVISEHFPFFL